MITIAVSIALFTAILAFVLFIRPQAIPAEEAAAPTSHLEGRKQTIYDNLRDLNFEFRLGKLSQADYDKTKTGLQNELASVLAEIDRVSSKTPKPSSPAPAPSQKPSKPPAAFTCAYCGAEFDRPMKFCGECGKTPEETTA